MQAIRRAVLQGLKAAPAQQQLRGMATKSIGELENSIKKETMGLYIMLGLCVVFIGRDIIHGEEEFEGTIPPYPYLRIRNKEFPWGPNGMLEHRRLVGEKPE